MRPLTIILLLIACGVGYGMYRSQQAQHAKELRVAAVRDSTRRADSLAYEAINAKIGQQAAAQVAAQQGMAVLQQAQAANNAVRR